ncbi:ATP-binding protein [Cyanobacterium sp. DS4]|uniref:ATP-binding protein n=1 Tax=Cyanobacterium sp. DS4 TaxID=2878255 RepID=UPI002E80CE88|nr:ATP-binding protein [Cyanobacterium sp. Dongsha4]WVK99113.1 GAF domain-containing protein [Cyanobacterium sp. Dongsha4]
MMSNIVEYNNGHIFSQLGAELVFTQNAQGEYLSFYWKSDIYNQSNLDQNTFQPLVKQTYLERIQRVIKRKIPEQCNYVFCHEQFCLPFELIISPIILSNGVVESVLVMGRSLDNASHLSIESTSALPTNPDPYQQLLTSIARKIRRTLDLETIGQQTVDSIGKALKASRCLLLMPTNSNSQILEVKAEYCEPRYKSLLTVQIKYNDYEEMKEAIMSRNAMIFNPSHYPDCDALSILLVPTFYQQELNGIICLHQCDRPRSWNEAEQELVQELADQVGTAMAHATIYQKLEIANNEAKEASRLKSEFLASTSHELRTPLNGILGFLKLVLDDMADDKEEEREFIDQAYNSALHLLNLINDILDIAKIEAGKMEFELTSISWNQICDEIQKFAHSQAQKKNLYFHIELPSTYDEILLYADYQRLLQVMLNLVGNSLKFTQEGGIEIKGEIVPKQIEINDVILPGVLKISVEDTGIGVALDKQERLFETFYQVDGSRTKAYGGTGLGLAISKRLVEAMGGKISFYSMGEFLGTTVTFTVPLAQLPLLRTENPDNISE